MPAAETRLFIALYLDADVDQELANQLRKRGFDAASARDFGKYKNSDQEQLCFI